MADIDQTGIPYSQYAAAYRQVYGTAPPLDAGMADYYAQNPDAIYNPKFRSAQGQIPLSTLMAIAGNKGGAGTAAPATPAAIQSGSSYFGAAPTITYGGGGGNAGGASSSGGTSTMTWQQVGQQIGLSQGDINAFTQQGWSPDEVYQSFSSGAGAPRGTPASKQAAAPVAPVDTTQPETRALGQMAQIDPTSEALRQQLGQSYLTSLTTAPTGAPQATDVQSYLDLYKQIDPEGYAQRTGMATSMDAYLQQAQQEAALGATLDDATRREVEQATRAGQSARGNVYGTPQLVEEAMSRGSAGEARKQQRQQALASALGQQQSYLGAGLGIGDVGNALYQQGYARNLAQKQQAQGAAQGWLGSGATPYQAGASYLNMAENRAATAAQGGPQYNPASLGQSYGASQFPQYGLDIGAQAQNYYNSLAAYGGAGGATKNKGAAAASGALSGALSGAVGGATIGSAIPGVGTVIGGAAGALGGAALGGGAGYFS